MNALWPCHSSTPKSASKLSVMVTHGIFQPIRAFRHAMSACGAREAYTSVVACALRAVRLFGRSRVMYSCSSQPPNESDLVSNGLERGSVPCRALAVGHEIVLPKDGEWRE